VGRAGELFYLKIKWWVSVHDAIETAKKQVIQDLARFPVCLGRRVFGGIIAILDWKKNEGQIRLIVSTVGLADAIAG
jgi:hypothetical protein